MNNIEFVACVGSEIKKLVNEAEKMNCVVAYEVVTHAKQYVVKGFDYDLSCVSAVSEKRMINLKNYEYIVFSYVDNKAPQYVHAILFSYDIMCNMSELLNEKQDLLSDKQDLTERLNDLRDLLQASENQNKKIKSQHDFLKLKYETMEELFYGLYEKLKGDN